MLQYLRKKREEGGIHMSGHSKWHNIISSNLRATRAGVICKISFGAILVQSFLLI